MNIFVWSVFWIIVFGVSCAIWGPGAGVAVVIPPCVMDFDHVRGVKLFSLCRGYNKSARMLREEIEKCDLVCANCHRLRTTMRRYGIV